VNGNAVIKPDRPITFGCLGNAWLFGIILPENGSSVASGDLVEVQPFERHI